jgi:hypothetical protein
MKTIVNLSTTQNELSLTCDITCPFGCDFPSPNCGYHIEHSECPQRKSIDEYNNALKKC